MHDELTKAIRLIEEAPFAHPKLTEAQMVLLRLRERAAALPTLEVEDLRAALEVISEGRHPDGHRGAVLVARAALIGKAVPRG